MHRALRSTVLSFCFLSALVFAPASVAQNRPVSVFVFSDVPIAPQVLQTAEQRASEIFSRSGIYIVWMNCLHSSGVPDAECSQSYSPTDLSLRFTSHTSHVTSDDALGVAWLGNDGIGRYADIFWPRAEQIHALSNVDLGLIAGCIMAHEMGHLLLGANSHSASGLMQAHWRGPELHSISMGTFVFLPDQARRMQDSISAARTVLVSYQRSKRLVP